MSDPTDEETHLGKLLREAMAGELRFVAERARDLGYEEAADEHDGEADRIERGEEG